MNIGEKRKETSRNKKVKDSFGNANTYIRNKTLIFEKSAINTFP